MLAKYLHLTNKSGELQDRSAANQCVWTLGSRIQVLGVLDSPVDTWEDPDHRLILSLYRANRIMDEVRSLARKWALPPLYRLPSTIHRPYSPWLANLNQNCGYTKSEPLDLSFMYNSPLLTVEVSSHKRWTSYVMVMLCGSPLFSFDRCG